MRRRISSRRPMRWIVELIGSSSNNRPTTNATALMAATARWEVWLRLCPIWIMPWNSSASTVTPKVESINASDNMTGVSNPSSRSAFQTSRMGW